jgi:hypothetical protein
LLNGSKRSLIFIIKSSEISSPGFRFVKWRHCRMRTKRFLLICPPPPKSKTLHFEHSVSFPIIFEMRHLGYTHVKQDTHFGCANIFLIIYSWLLLNSRTETLSYNEQFQSLVYVNQ